MVRRMALLSNGVESNLTICVLSDILRHQEGMCNVSAVLNGFRRLLLTDWLNAITPCVEIHIQTAKQFAHIRIEMKIFHREQVNKIATYHLLYIELV